MILDDPHLSIVICQLSFSNGNQNVMLSIPRKFLPATATFTWFGMQIKFSPGFDIGAIVIQVLCLHVEEIIFTDLFFMLTSTCPFNPSTL